MKHSTHQPSTNKSAPDSKDDHEDNNKNPSVRTNPYLSHGTPDPINTDNIKGSKDPNTAI